jgi:hypothetical protein
MNVEVWDETGMTITDWYKKGTEIFLQGGLDTKSREEPVGQITFDKAAMPASDKAVIAPKAMNLLPRQPRDARRFKFGRNVLGRLGNNPEHAPQSPLQHRHRSFPQKIPRIDILAYPL